MPGKRRRQRRQQQSLLRFLILVVVLVHVQILSRVKAFTPPPSTNKNKHKNKHVFLQVLNLYLPRRQSRSSHRIGSSGTTGRSTVLRQQRNTSSSSSTNRIEEDADSSNHVQDASNTTTIRTSSGRSSNVSTKLTTTLTRISKGYQRRINADRHFVQKSLVEILVAAGTQLMAEWNRRGSFHTILLQIDFVVPAVLTAVFGKYYSMWRTAKTLDDDNLDDGRDHDGNTGSIDINSMSETTTDPTFFGVHVPTNAFQARMADGTTIPTVQQRVSAFVVPMPALFRAGILASGVGYGLAAVLVSLRTVVVPSYVTGTVPVNIVAASLYTGCFMALVSNVRYQILQGLIEPILIDRWLFPATTPCSEEEQHPRQQQDQQEQHNDVNTNSNGSRHRQPRIPVIFRPVLIFVIRWLNGLLGSVLAINGMRLCGLQRMKG